MILFDDEFLRLILVEADSTVMAVTRADPSLICLKNVYLAALSHQDHHYQLVNKVCRDIFFVPLGNFLNDHLSFINSAC